MKLRTRRLLRWALILIWCVVLVEGGAFVSVWALDGQRPGYWRRAERQEDVAAWEPRGGEVGKMRERAEAEERNRAQWHAREIRHPYLAFVSRPRHDHVSPRLSRLSGLALADPESALFQEQAFVVGIGGGSVAAALSGQSWRTLVEQLEASPALEGRRVHVFAFANAGYKQPQTLIGLAYSLSCGVKFDAVINLDGFNEIALYQEVEATLGVFPPYPRVWAQRMRLSDEDLALAGRLGVIEADRAGAAMAVLESPLRYSWARQLLWLHRDRVREGRWQAIVDEVGRRKEEDEIGGLDFYEHTGPRRHYEDPLDAIPEQVSIWANSSRAMASLCRGVGAAYVHAIQPNQYDPEHPKPMGAEERALAINPESHFSRAVPAAYPLLRARAEELRGEGVLVLDLTGLFDEVEQAMYMDDCCHLKKIGYDVIARELAQGVLAQL